MSNVIELFPKKEDEPDQFYAYLRDKMSGGRYSDADIDRIIDEVKSQVGEYEYILTGQPLKIHVTEEALDDAGLMWEQIDIQLGPLVSKLLESSLFFASTADIYREKHFKRIEKDGYSGKKISERLDLIWRKCWSKA